MKPVRVEERRVPSFDGTEVAYHVTGEGPPVLLANGLGGSWKAWKHQLAHLGDRYRFVSWDYRGLYRSGPPGDRDALGIDAQVRDALAVLDAEDIERTAVLGWSMGVQVALELFRVAPERVSTLVLVNGVAGRPWETVLDVAAMRHVVPRALSAARAALAMPQAIERLLATPITRPRLPARMPVKSTG